MSPLFKIEKPIDTKYSRSIMIPHYEIKNERKISLEELVDKKKVSELMYNINKANISEEEKEFLKIATYRHYVFHYDLIAEYYAQATPEMQKLMEDSALVIIDVDNAIANGYVQLSKRMNELISDAKKQRGK